jgi:hypothetical protein
MREGWAGDDYLVLFSDSEVEFATARYQIERFLPGHVVVGLRGWDNLIVRDKDGSTYTVPCVPIITRHVTGYALQRDIGLESDSRFTGKIKWDTKPLIFGGDPDPGKNLTWVTHEQHGELVVWWNLKHNEVRGDDSA